MPLLSSNVHIIVICAAPDASPTNLTANATSRSVTLQWRPPPVLNRNGILTHYVVVLANRTWNISQNVTGQQRKKKEPDSEGVGEDTQSLTFEHLKPFTTYTWEVAAVSGFGPGPASDGTVFKTDQDGEWLQHYILLASFSEYHVTNTLTVPVYDIISLVPRPFVLH